MERITKRSPDTTKENGVCCTHFLSPSCLSVEGNCADGCRWEEAAWARLADYEDTGLTPAEVRSMSGEWCAMMSVLNSIGGYDRLRELAEADKDGRVVVLPCKVGDMVYVIDKGDYGHNYQPYVRAKTVYEITCKSKKNGTQLGWGVCLGPGDCGTIARHRMDKLGQSWFLTSEEAERMLEERNG